MTRAFLLLPLLAAAACGAADPSTTVEEQSLTAPLWSDDFEADGVGKLPSTWALSGAGASSVSIVATADHGHALSLHGSTVAGDFITASLNTTQTSSDFTTSFDVQPAAGASPSFVQRGTGFSYSRQQLRLFRVPGSDTLWAGTPSGNIACGTLASSVWSHVSLRVRFSTSTFDVAINGVTTCAGLTTRLGPPALGVAVFDPSNEGYGGDTLFDNFSGG